VSIVCDETIYRVGETPLVDTQGTSDQRFQISRDAMVSCLSRGGCRNDDHFAIAVFPFKDLGSIQIKDDNNGTDFR
jgi:hypothetical protein